jgi:hypothetical protein
VNRDSGTDSVNGGWLRRLVELSRYAAGGLERQCHWPSAEKFFAGKLSSLEGMLPGYE